MLLEALCIMFMIAVSFIYNFPFERNTEKQICRRGKKFKASNEININLCSCAVHFFVLCFSKTQAFNIRRCAVSLVVVRYVCASIKIMKIMISP